MVIDEERSQGAVQERVQRTMTLRRASRQPGGRNPGKRQTPLKTGHTHECRPNAGREDRAPAVRATASAPFQGVSRKEVFQPHLPVRLPCYDLAPITSFALGRPSR